MSTRQGLTTAGENRLAISHRHVTSSIVSRTLEPFVRPLHPKDEDAKRDSHTVLSHAAVGLDAVA